MRKVWFALALFLLILPVTILFFHYGPAISMEAAAPSGGAPDTPSGFKSGSGFPLVQQTHQGYDQSTSEGSPILLRQAPLGPYEEEEQGAWGNIQHRLVGEAEILRLTPSFKVMAGAVAEVVLSKTHTPTKDEIAAAPVLSELQATEGSQEYEVSVDQDFAAVVIYDRKADTVLAIAQLEPEPVCEEIPKRGALASEQVKEAPKTCIAINDTDQLNKTGMPPGEVDLEEYRLVVDGAVEHPLSLTFEDLKQYPATSEVVLLICSGFFADNVEWTGVPLSAVLEEAQAEPGYKAVRLESGADGYWVALERDEIDPEDVILAYQVNGEDIPLEHGYPVRVVIRDEYGSQWVKWLKHIEVMEK